MKRLIALLIVVAGCFAPGLRAQTLTLDQAIMIARDSATAAHLAASSLRQSEWEHEQFLAQRRPQIFFGMDVGYQKMSFEPSTHFYKLRNYNMFNSFAELRLEQKALAAGGEFYATTGTLWTRYFNQDDPLRMFSTIPLGVGYCNDLISYNPYKWEKALNDLKYKTDQKEYLHTLGRISLETARLYLTCYVSMAKYDICVNNASVAAELLEIGREKFNMASLSKNELSALELQSLNAENSLFNARQQMEDARERLLSYLKIDAYSQEIQLEAPPVPEYKIIPADEALLLAKDNDPDYLRIREQIISARQQAGKAEAQGRLLQTGVDINLGFQGTTAAIGNVYAGQQPFLAGSVTLRIPIYDGGLARSRKKVAQYRIEYSENAEREAARQLELDVVLTLREFNVQQDLVVRTRRALALADESFDLAQDLYRQGETDINTFILAQNRKDEAHTNYLNSLTGFWVSYYTLCLICNKEF